MEFVNISQTGPFKVAFLCRPEITLEEIFRKLRPLGKVVAIDRGYGPVLERQGLVFATFKHRVNIAPQIPTVRVFTEEEPETLDRLFFVLSESDTLESIFKALTPYGTLDYIHIVDPNVDESVINDPYYERRRRVCFARYTDHQSARRAKNSLKSFKKCSWASPQKRGPADKAKSAYTICRCTVRIEKKNKFHHDKICQWQLASGAVTINASSSSESFEENFTFIQDTTDPPARSNNLAATNVALPEAGNIENHLDLSSNDIAVENTVEAEVDLLEQLVNATEITPPENMMEEYDPGHVEVEETYVPTVLTAIPNEIFRSRHHYQHEKNFRHQFLPKNQCRRPLQSLPARSHFRQLRRLKITHRNHTPQTAFHRITTKN